MHIKQLDIYGLRNLPDLRLELSPSVNAFCGCNGCGKTSVLEAIYLLGLGRSFRANNSQIAIQFGKSKYVVAATLANHGAADAAASLKIGTEKARDNLKALFQQEGAKCKLSAIARMLPLLLLDTGSFGLVDGGPALRREFIDFAMFHVEHSFLEASQQFRRALLQRNAELKRRTGGRLAGGQLAAWGEIMLQSGTKISAARRQFIADFQPLLAVMLSDWRCPCEISFNYRQGWDENLSLQQALAESDALDHITGFTNRGPHRAELEILVDGVPAKHVLSRGQQKVFACAMILAKALFLQQKAQINSIFLIDDLHSELDGDSFALVLERLLELGGQIFITGIELQSLLTRASSLGAEVKMFHVEHFGVAK